MFFCFINDIELKKRPKLNIVLFVKDYKHMLSIFKNKIIYDLMT